ncbi:MAG: peptidoglycan DD-metalloendopeptidase family protein, partial [Anaerolineaceae bacterium]
SGTDQVIWDAIRQEIASRPEAFLFEAYDWELSQVTYSADQMQAVVWLDPLDPATGMTIATEPMVVIAELSPDGLSSESSSWQIVFQGDSDWNVKASTVGGLLPNELAISLEEAPGAPEAPQAALGGYKLPWAAGLTKTLEWSTEHTSCSGSFCYYALDFADGSMFPLLAAKGGRVFYAFDDYNNNDNLCHTDTSPCHYHTNQLILEDLSTTPASYQIYLHLAHDSIPTALHQKGTPVLQGQYIGNVDNTGASSGHHLHFMVHTSSNGYWGPSVDITFRDVPINWDATTQGGRPRTKAGAQKSGGEWQTNYTSQNYGTNPPTGGLSLPGDKVTLMSEDLATAGWGADNIAVTRLQLIAYYDNSWHEVGAPQTVNPFNYNLDVCSAAIPAGPFDLALRVWDYEGNQSLTPLGIRHLVNAVDCPEQTDPVCVPNSQQVAIYSDINFSGSCKLLGIGNHDASQFAPVLNNDVSSVILGDNVQLRIYDGDSWSYRRETLTNSDRNLSDNPTGNDRLSSASVQLRAFTLILTLDGTDPHGPSSVGPTAVDSITLAWRSDGSTKYQSRIFSGTIGDCTGSSPLIAREPVWAISPTWSIGTLPARDYTWCVQGRIAEPAPGNTPHYSSWAMKTFTVSPGALTSQTTRTLLYTETVESEENGWNGSGLWHIPDKSNTAINHVWACNNTGGDYGDPVYGGGDLTSPPIQIPGGGATLRFNYRYETESDQVFWDQRWVQISRDGGRFENLTQLSDDPMNTWLTSPAIDLTTYAGSTVRIRFHFSIADKYYNGGLEGWLVDDVIVTPKVTEGCEEYDNSLASAGPISYGDELPGSICPAGDVDYYKFHVNSGDKLIAMVKAKQLMQSSLLDTHLTLLDQDQYGNSPIYDNDDMQAGVMTDSQLYFIAPEDGYYYLKVKSSDYPISGGSSYFYTISLTEQPATTDIVAPSLTIEYPARGDGIRSEAVTFSALAEDLESGVSRVDFWWHAPNWTSDTWTLLTSDSYGADGWQIGLDGSGYAEGQSGALAVIAYDWAENARVVVNWNVPIDDSPPVTALNPLPPLINSNGIYLSWSARDSYSRIQGFDIQYQPEDGEWQTWLAGIQGGRRGAWFLGEAGQYNFRMHGLDSAGNQEGFPTGVEAATVISGSCNPDPFDQVGDDQALDATVLNLDAYQVHNYCEVDDIDWVKFNAQAGQTYLITIWPDSASPLGSSIDLYQSNEGNLLFHSVAPGLMSPLMIKWQAPAEDLYLLRLSSLLSGIMGDNTAYSIRVGTGNWFNFPAIFTP